RRWMPLAARPAGARCCIASFRSQKTRRRDDPDIRIGATWREVRVSIASRECSGRGRLELQVLHVYSGNLNGGVESLLKTLAAHRRLCPTMEPHFALCFEGDLAHALRASGTSPTMLGRVRISQPWTILQARTVLANLLRREHFDVVVC